MSIQVKKDIRVLIAVIISALVYATAMKAFVESGNLFPGGFAGLSRMFSQSLSQFAHIEIPYLLSAAEHSADIACFPLCRTALYRVFRLAVFPDQPVYRTAAKLSNYERYVIDCRFRRNCRRFRYFHCA